MGGGGVDSPPLGTALCEVTGGDTGAAATGNLFLKSPLCGIIAIIVSLSMPRGVALHGPKVSS